ncbi:MAG: hypothetical protein COA32_10350 [Fluviicola sp.]|nr:MAG: hypothetical protein COA32_10350 [Fluviicola sp.]
MFLAFFGCSQNCSTQDIDLIGSWEVYKVELVDADNKLKDFFESENQDFEAYSKGVKIFEEVEYLFKEEGVLFVKNPEELGGDGETTYSFKKGSDEIIIGERNYGFAVNSCSEIEIVDFTPFESAWLTMYCRRVDEK